MDWYGNAFRSKPELIYTCYKAVKVFIICGKTKPKEKLLAQRYTMGI